MSWDVGFTEKAGGGTDSGLRVECDESRPALFGGIGLVKSNGTDSGDAKQNDIKGTVFLYFLLILPTKASISDMGIVESK